MPAGHPASMLAVSSVMKVPIASWVPGASTPRPLLRPSVFPTATTLPGAASLKRSTGSAAFDVAETRPSAASAATDVSGRSELEYFIVFVR